MNLGLAHRVVLHLVKELEGQGYTIYMDNVYSSPVLYADFHSREGFNACGTVNSNRKNIL